MNVNVVKNLVLSGHGNRETQLGLMQLAVEVFPPDAVLERIRQGETFVTEQLVFNDPALSYRFVARKNQPVVGQLTDQTGRQCLLLAEFLDAKRTRYCSYMSSGDCPAILPAGEHEEAGLRNGMAAYRHDYFFNEAQRAMHRAVGREAHFRVDASWSIYLCGERPIIFNLGTYRRPELAFSRI